MNTIKDGVKQAMDENNLKVEGYLTAGLEDLNSRLDELVRGGNDVADYLTGQVGNLNSKLEDLIREGNGNEKSQSEFKT